MVFKFKAQFVALLALLAVGQTFAADLYVAVGGSGSSCSSGTPCADLATAVGIAVSGDTIFVGSGVYSGANNSGLAIANLASLRIAAVAGSQPIFDLAGSTAPLFVSTGSSVSVEGVVIRNGLGSGVCIGVDSASKLISFRCVTLAFPEPEIYCQATKKILVDV